MVAIRRHQSNAIHFNSFIVIHLLKQKMRTGPFWGNDCFWNITMSLAFTLSKNDRNHGKSVVVNLVKSNAI